VGVQAQRYDADPTSDFATRLREHVTHELLPPLRELEALLQRKGGELEMPSQSFFEDKYPSRGAGSIEQYVGHVGVYSRSWQRIVDQWGEGNFGTARPYGYFPFVMAALLEENIRSSLSERQALLDTECGVGIETQWSAGSLKHPLPCVHLAHSLPTFLESIHPQDVCISPRSLRR
jgi:hypothetical protein